jgi:hypothetical protein
MYPHLKTEKHLTPAQRNTYLKALHALETKQYGLTASLLGPLVAEEPEFFVGRKQLRQAQILGPNGKTTFLGLPGSDFQRGKPQVHFVGALFKLFLVGFLNLLGLPLKEQLHLGAFLSKGIGQMIRSHVLLESVTPFSL